MAGTVRFLQSIASATWSYAMGDVVRVGSIWKADEIPAENAEAFLRGGLVEIVTPAESPPPAEEPVVAPPPPVEFAVPPVPIETTAVAHRRPKRTR